MEDYKCMADQSSPIYLAFPLSVHMEDYVLETFSIRASTTSFILGESTINVNE